jgi:hypothetical protein
VSTVEILVVAAKVWCLSMLIGFLFCWLMARL